MDDQAGRDMKQMHLGIGDVKFLICIYLLLLLAGLSLTIRGMMTFSSGSSVYSEAIIYCASMSLVGTSIYYVRKIYKALINQAYTFIERDSSDFISRLKRIGTLTFFIFRPIFGVSFSVVVYALWRLSLAASGAEGGKPTIGFLYTTISLGFVSGFLAGRLLTLLEGYGARRLGGILGTEE